MSRRTLNFESGSAFGPVGMIGGRDKRADAIKAARSIREELGTPEHVSALVKKARQIGNLQELSTSRAPARERSEYLDRRIREASGLPVKPPKPIAGQERRQDPRYRRLVITPMLSKDTPGMRGGQR